jgi:signal transduction histidine kinase
VLRNVRLIEELRESRRRIVAAVDEGRRRLERNIHDGAQQQLVALAVKLRLADGLVERDPARARQLISELQGETTDALENLRDLARGIYPPLLADEGLTTALEAQTRKSPVRVRIHVNGVGRYPQEVEATVYFCVLEALNNVAKYGNADNVDVALRREDGRLAFEVRDDGVGFDPGAVAGGTGLQGMADRVEALGGTLEVESAPGHGTVVTGRLPIG